MVHLEAKHIRGKTYYYLIEKGRVHGISRKTKTVYLGTAEGIWKQLQGLQPAPVLKVRVKAHPFGPIAALLRMAKNLRFVETVDHYAQKRTSGFSVGQYLLLCILARALEPWSKAATGRWFYRKSFLRFDWDAPHEVNSENILSNLRGPADLQVQRRIEEAFTKTLIERGLRPDLLLWDVSNWSNYIEQAETLPHSGKAKDRRYDLNLVSKALAVAEDHIPLMHETCPENVDEGDVFEKTVDALEVSLTRLHLETSEMILVMNKGTNSDANLAKVTEWKHVVGALAANLAPDLMDLDLDKFSPLHATGRGHDLPGYLTRRVVYQPEFNIAVTYNAVTAKRKTETYLLYEKRFLEWMAKLKEGYERTSGCQIGYPQAAQRAAELVPKDHASPLRYTLPLNPKTLEFHVDPEKRDGCCATSVDGCSSRTSTSMPRR